VDFATYFVGLGFGVKNGELVALPREDWAKTPMQGHFDALLRLRLAPDH